MEYSVFAMNDQSSENLSKVITLRLTVAEHERLTKKADQHERSVSWIIRRVVGSKTDQEIDEIVRG